MQIIVNCCNLLYLWLQRTISSVMLVSLSMINSFSFYSTLNSSFFCLSFNLKAKAEGPAEVSAAKPQSALLHALPSGSSPPSVQPQTAALANAVRIERLSDDEDVDITDDLSDDASQPENRFDFRDEPKGLNQPQDQRGQTQTAFSTGRLINDVSDVVETSDTPAEGNSSCFQTGTEPEPGDHKECWDTKLQPQHGDECTEGTYCLFLRCIYAWTTCPSHDYMLIQHYN